MSEKKIKTSRVHPFSRKVRTFAFSSDSIFTLWQAATHRSDWKPIIYPWIQLRKALLTPACTQLVPAAGKKQLFRISLLLRKKLLVYHIHRFFKQVSEKKSSAQRKHAFTFRYRLAEEIDKKVWTGLEPEKQYWYWKPKRFFKDTVHFFFFTCSPGRFWWCFPLQCWNRK